MYVLVLTDPFMWSNVITVINRIICQHKVYIARLSQCQCGNYSLDKYDVKDYNIKQQAEGKEWIEV